MKKPSRVEISVEGWPEDTLDTASPKSASGAQDTLRSGGTTSLLLLILVGALCATLYWGLTFNLDVYSRADGEVIPAGKVRTVQHLEGGIVQEILVSEGDTIEAGQELMVLQQTESDADRNQLALQIASLRASFARLTAEADGQDAPNFPEDLLANHWDIINEAQNFFDARSAELRSNVATLEQVIQQRRVGIDEVRVRRRNSVELAKLLDEQIDISDTLVARNLSNRYEHLELLKERQKLRSLIDEDSATIRRAEAALNEAVEQQSFAQKQFLTRARQELEIVNRDLATSTERMRVLEDNLVRTTVRAPVDGIIKSLFVVTQGGVVRPGDAIFDIVPGGEELIIEAHLPPQDIGYVRPGQDALIQLASSDASRLGAIQGKVTLVSPDTVSTSSGVFYRVQVATKQTFFGADQDRFDLVPGVIVSVGVHVGQRTVLDYLLTPFTSSALWRLTER